MTDDTDLVTLIAGTRPVRRLRAWVTQPTIPDEPDSPRVIDRRRSLITKLIVVAWLLGLLVVCWASATSPGWPN